MFIQQVGWLSWANSVLETSAQHFERHVMSLSLLLCSSKPLTIILKGVQKCWGKEARPRISSHWPLNAAQKHRAYEHAAEACQQAAMSPAAVWMLPAASSKTPDGLSCTVPGLDTASLAHGKDNHACPWLCLWPNLQDLNVFQRWRSAEEILATVLTASSSTRALSFFMSQFFWLELVNNA